MKTTIALFLFAAASSQAADLKVDCNKVDQLLTAQSVSFEKTAVNMQDQQYKLSVLQILQQIRQQIQQECQIGGQQQKPIEY